MHLAVHLAVHHDGHPPRVAFCFPGMGDDVATGTVADARPGENRLEVAITIPLAVVAVTAALAAWRTSAVGSQVADNNRAGLIDATKQSAMHHINESSAFAEADYAAQTAMKSAESKALVASG